MARVAVTITQQKQRWFRAYCQISNYSARSGNAPSASDRKRARSVCVTAVTSSMNNSLCCTTDSLATYNSNTSGNSIQLRYHSSTPESTTPTFRSPLHRNPSRITSSVGSIYRPPNYLLGTDNKPVILPVDDYVLADSVRSCIKVDETDEYNNENDDSSTENEKWKNPRDKELKEMSLCFIGTGAGSPANIRSTSCTLLKLSGTNYLFDVGEGTQRQLQFARGKGSTINKIEKIFVTHLHGDHIFGLPGLLLSLQTSCIQSDENARATTNTEKGNRRRRRKNGKQDDDGDDFTVQIYGPPGLFNYIASSITLSCTRLHLLNVEVYELMNGRVRRVATPPQSFGKHLPRRSPQQQQQQQQSFRDPFRDDYPEFRYNGGNIQRILIPCENGVWNIQHKLPPLTRQDIMASASRESSGGGRIIAKKQQDRIRIRAAEVDHIPGVATFGYVVEEDEPPRNLDVSKARALGVSHKDKKYELLKHGFAVETDDGSGRMVEPHEVVKASSKKARKIAIVGDNRGWTTEMTEIARDADVLVHEATLLEEDNSRGHSTAAKAGRNAELCDAKLLILNHISPKMERDMPLAVREAYNAASRKVSVLMSFDFLEVLVPWLGFGTTTATPECDSNSDSDAKNSSTGSNDEK